MIIIIIINEHANLFSNHFMSCCVRSGSALWEVLLAIYTVSMPFHSQYIYDINMCYYSPIMIIIIYNGRYNICIIRSVERGSPWTSTEKTLLKWYEIMTCNKNNRDRWLDYKGQLLKGMALLACCRKKHIETASIFHMRLCPNNNSYSYLLWLVGQRLALSWAF